MLGAVRSHGKKVMQPRTAGFAVRGAKTKTWVPTDASEIQKITTQAMIHEVAEKQKEQANRVVPWFLQNMPASYFQQASAAAQAQHVQAITTVRELMQADLQLKMVTKEEDGSGQQVTLISDGTAPGSLHSQLEALSTPKGHDLAEVDVFSSLDGEVSLNMYSYACREARASARRPTAKTASHIFKYAQEIREGKYAGDSTVPAATDLMSVASLEEYFQRLAASYPENSSNPRRFLNQRVMYDKIHGTDGVEVNIEAYRHTLPDNLSRTWVTVAAANVLPEVLLRICSKIVSARGLDITRCHLDTIEDPENSTEDLKGNVVMLRLLVSSLEGQYNLNDNEGFANILQRDLKRSKWLDNQTTELGLRKFPHLGLDKAEIITAFCAMLHGPLAKENAQYFGSIASILQVLSSHTNYIDIAESIATLFLDRFNPHTQQNDLNKPGSTVGVDSSMSDEMFETRSASIRNKIGVLQNEAAAIVLSNMLNAVGATLRTNFYNENRYALSMRMDPKIMVPESTKTRPTPYGVFFCHGRHFNAFHCRFRDIARGGLRIVTPQNTDQYALESARQFDEVYGLSYAQQLKNKDIPEGGAKGVILVNTAALHEDDRFFAMRKSVKAFSDSMLDLMVKDSVKNLVDYYRKEELIYFGPDEQIIPSDLEWIVKRAGERGYPIPDAVMSSKKDNGMNHKDYGVTSEGVVVFLDVALRSSLGINPDTDPFTVKITGGPDGDVAGNLIMMLYRDYGDNAKVVGIADGFGVAEDPEGLDSTELLRLVKHSLPITEFDKSKLSAHGIALPVTCEDGLAKRNSMHFRVKADAFVPAGGRPNTINGANWKQFLQEDGTPSSPLIVEGANIFTTPEARKNLFEQAGVTIVKDSSANKCGVITSSLEVASSMLLTKQEFMDIKDPLVADVVVQLRKLARLEAELLFREYKNYPGALPQFSERISNAIGKVTDAITDALADVGPGDALFEELLPLVTEGLPVKLAAAAGPERIRDNFPVQYQRNAIASVLASKLVYKEGIHLVETQPEEVMGDRAISYYREDKKIAALLAELEAKNAPSDADKAVVDLLRRGGARTSLNIF